MKKLNKKFQLLVQDKNCTPFIIHRLNKIMSVNLKKILHNPPSCICEFLNGDINWYVDKRLWDESSLHITENVFKNQKYWLNFNKKLLSIIKKFKKDLETINKIDFHNLDLLDSIKIYKRIIKSFEDVYTYGIIPTITDMGEPIFSSRLKEILSLKGVEDINTIFVLLTTPMIKSELIKMEEHLSNLSKIKDLTKDSVDVTKHAKKYFWSTFGYEGPLNSNDLVWGQVLDMRDANFKSKGDSEIKIRDIEKKYLNANERNLFKIARDWIFLKGFRKEVFFFCYAVMDGLAQRLAEILKTNKKDIKFLSFEEVCNLASNKKMKFVGRDHSVWYFDKEDIILIDKDAHSFLDKYVIRERINIKKQINGQVAFTGVVSGYVRIVNSVSDISKLNRGDILVSFATNPNLLPAMKLASAFITDVGGITCHAAIVARELKKPCIIGTKIATKVLKDGDLVEVDAEKGIVTIIDKTK